MERLLVSAQTRQGLRSLPATVYHKTCSNYNLSDKLHTSQNVNILRTSGRYQLQYITRHVAITIWVTNCTRVRMSTYWGRRTFSLECSSWRFKEQYTFSTHFKMSAETFLLLTVLAYQVHSSRFFTVRFFLQLTRYINFLLTYLLTYCYIIAVSCFIHRFIHFKI